MVTKRPQHIAIIMDGNGRWAAERDLPRIKGHEAGAEAVRSTLEQCVRNEIEVLTLFAFSRENWGRPSDEVNALMQLFIDSLRDETDELNEREIRVRIVGDISSFAPELQAEIARTEKITAKNTGLTLVIAANYSGRWDMTQACRRIAYDVLQKNITLTDIDESRVHQYHCLSDLPEPDLLIRTSSEQRISNFLLWQIAYAEIYFTDACWPDFKEEEFAKALAFFAERERRFGLTAEQLEESLC